MKLNKKKISALLGVGLISSLTFGPTLNTQAALTAPAFWTFKYTNEDFPGFKLTTTTSLVSIPTYIRTSSSSYFNYTSTFNVDGGSFTVGHTFNRSNTSWVSNTAGEYIPSSASIGSDNSVGTISNKVQISLNNGSNSDYLFYLDMSSTDGGDLPINIKYNSNNTGLWYGDYYYQATGALGTLFIPAETQVLISVGDQSKGIKLDAWYLKDLGFNAAWNNGYDYGYNIGYADGFDDTPSLLIMGFSAMVGILVNFGLMILNLEVFGVSIMGIFSILVLLTGIVWVLKLIRG